MLIGRCFNLHPDFNLKGKVKFTKKMYSEIFNTRDYNFNNNSTLFYSEFNSTYTSEFLLLISPKLFGTHIHNISVL